MRDEYKDSINVVYTGYSGGEVRVGSRHKCAEPRNPSKNTFRSLGGLFMLKLE